MSKDIEKLSQKLENTTVREGTLVDIGTESTCSTLPAQKET